MVALFVGASCRQPQQEPAGPAERPASLGVSEILQRCVGAHARLETLHAEGVLRDLRDDRRRGLAVIWDFQRPDRCRLQIGMDVALVLGDGWWTYDSRTGAFKKHRQFTRTPIETAALLLSDGVPFLLPALWTRGESALGKNRTGGFSGWQLKGVAWEQERPCYVLERWEDSRQAPARTLRVWIDQDSWFLRGWAMVVAGGGRPEYAIVSCHYHRMEGDARLAPDCFQLKPPARTPAPPTSARVSLGGAHAGLRRWR